MSEQRGSWFQGLRQFAEEKVGLPSLKELPDALRNIPDEARLKVIRDIVRDVGKIKGSPEELMIFLAILKIISETDMEKLRAIKDITANLVKLSKILPMDMLGKLPVEEIIGEIKKAI